MKNLLHRPIARLGMPYHGLVTDTVLSTPDGDITVAHDASVEGAIAFQVRNPPGNNPNAAQAAMDTAHGWEWRDYALLNGWFRSVNGSHQLGELTWLYADTNDVVWVMQLVPALRGPVSGKYYYDIAVWRRQPFGRYRFGLPDRDLADELLTTFSVEILELSYRSGGSEITYPPALVGINLGLKASSIVPDLHGENVYISVLCSLAQALDGTQSYWELSLRGVWATAKLTLSGAGTLDGDGTGISAEFTDSLRYPDFITKAPEVPANPATIDPWPINHVASINSTTCDPPTGPGTCEETCETVFTHEGTVFQSYGAETAWDDLPGQQELGRAESFIFTYHGTSGAVQCFQTYDRWQWFEYTTYLGGDGMESTRELTAVEDPPGTWYWEETGSTQLCSKWEEGDSDFYISNDVGIDINGNVDELTIEKHDYSWAASILGVGTPAGCNCIPQTSTDNWPSPSSTSTRTYTFSEPYTITDADTDAYCNLGQICRLIVFPGMIGYVAAHEVPNGTTTRTQIRHSGKLWGIGADGSLTLITSWGPVVEADLVIRFPWTSVAWQPMTKQYNVQTDGVTLVKYV